MDILISKEGVNMIWTFGITLCITLALIILFLIGVAVQHAYKEI